MSDIVDSADGANQFPTRVAVTVREAGALVPPTRVAVERRERLRASVRVSQPQERLAVRHLLAQMGVPGR